MGIIKLIGEIWRAIFGPSLKKVLSEEEIPHDDE